MQPRNYSLEKTGFFIFFCMGKWLFTILTIHPEPPLSEQWIIGSTHSPTMICLLISIFYFFARSTRRPEPPLHHPRLHSKESSPPFTILTVQINVFFCVFFESCQSELYPPLRILSIRIVCQNFPILQSPLFHFARPSTAFLLLLSPPVVAGNIAKCRSCN